MQWCPARRIGEVKRDSTWPEPARMRPAFDDHGAVHGIGNLAAEVRAEGMGPWEQYGMASSKKSRGGASEHPEKVDGVRPSNSLTRREVDILLKAANGLTDRQIARQLGISHKTVRNHLTNVFQKLAAKNRTQAILTAIRLGAFRADPRQDVEDPGRT